MKTCTKCKQKKPVEAFAPHPNTRDKKRPECLECCAAYHRAARVRRGRDHGREHELQRNYGIGVEQFNQMFARQGGRCGICSTHVTEITHGRWKQLAVDHDHDTGKVRGLLCYRCNTGLGNFADEPDRVRHALAYLKKHGKS